MCSKRNMRDFPAGERARLCGRAITGNPASYGACLQHNTSLQPADWGFAVAPSSLAHAHMPQQERLARMTAAVALVLLAIGCSGCGRSGPSAGPATDMPHATTRPAVTVRLVDHDGLMAEVQRHRGKVVVLDCWSTSCPPCVEEFPRLVSLAANHGDAVVCLSLAVEYDGIGKPDDFISPVQGFLEKVGAGGVVNFVASEEADAVYRKLDLESVPAVYIWKPDGSLAIRFDDDMAARELGRPFTYADVEATVTAVSVDLPRP